MNDKCLSCGMPIETGTYCQHCVDEHGHLKDFGAMFARMVAWQMRKGTAEGQAEKDTLDYLATMPAWADHPRVKKAKPSPSSSSRRPRLENEDA